MTDKPEPTTDEPTTDYLPTMTGQLVRLREELERRGFRTADGDNPGGGFFAGRHPTGRDGGFPYRDGVFIAAYFGHFRWGRNAGSPCKDIDRAADKIADVITEFARNGRLCGETHDGPCDKDAIAALQHDQTDRP